LNETEKVLEEKGINIPLENFVKGYIKKPISIPNTYQRLEDENVFFLIYFYI